MSIHASREGMVGSVRRPTWPLEGGAMSEGLRGWVVGYVTSAPFPESEES